MTRISHTLTFAPCLVFIAAVASACIVDDNTELGSISLSEHALSDSCPAGWYDAAVVNILCVEGFHLEYEVYGGTTCVQCQPDTEPTHCNGPWIPAAAEIRCLPGYIERINHAGTCKRCARQGPECRNDRDCFRTGCSGQICSNEHVVTTCEFLPKYACYSDELCGCNNRRCGWADDSALQECIDDASTNDSPVITL
jgi:eight-cysteine-cluster-containing protein